MSIKNECQKLAKHFCHQLSHISVMRLPELGSWKPCWSLNHRRLSFLQYEIGTSPSLLNGSLYVITRWRTKERVSEMLHRNALRTPDFVFSLKSTFLILTFLFLTVSIQYFATLLLLPSCTSLCFLSRHHLPTGRQLPNVTCSGWCKARPERRDMAISMCS